VFRPCRRRRRRRFAACKRNQALVVADLRNFEHLSRRRRRRRRSFSPFFEAKHLILDDQV